MSSSFILNDSVLVLDVRVSPKTLKYYLYFIIIFLLHNGCLLSIVIYIFKPVLCMSYKILPDASYPNPIA